MNIKLSESINPMYGNPLGLLIDEVRDVELTKEIDILLHAGVIVPYHISTDPVEKEVPINEVESVEAFSLPEDSPLPKPTRVKKKVIRKHR